jgi:Cu2+-exporting ATPase
MAPASTVSDMRDVPGEGVEARSQGRRVRIGRVEFVAGLCARPLPDELAFVADGVQVLALADEQRWLALFTLSDTLRPEAPALIAALRAAGATPCLLSGDRASVTQAVARSVGIETVAAEARPQDKVRFVRALQQGGAVVAMIGDGVNDAPVLAQAQVAIALGSGADLAQASADVVLAQGGIARVADLLAVARKAERIVRQNLLWAGAYNLIAVPAAVLGVVDPLLAAVGMAASSLVVVLNAMRAAHPVLWRRSRLVEAVRQPVTGPALRPA